MKIWDILKNVGTSIIRNVVPGGGMIVDVVNDLLPDDKKLPQDATGSQITDAINSLPPDQRARVMEKELDVDIEYIQQTYTTNRAMLEAESKSQHTTRPYIAKGSFHVTSFTILAAVGMWSYGVASGNDDMVKTVMDGWPFILSVIGPLVSLLWAYFGILKKESKDRLDAATGNNAPRGVAGLISSLIKKQ